MTPELVACSRGMRWLITRRVVSQILVHPAAIPFCRRSVYGATQRALLNMLSDSVLVEEQWNASD